MTTKPPGQAVIDGVLDILRQRLAKVESEIRLSYIPSPELYRRRDALRAYLKVIKPRAKETEQDATPAD